MNIVQIEEVVKNIVTNSESGDLPQLDFIYELLLAYGHRKQSVTRLKTGERNLARDEVNTVFWKRQLYFKVETTAELHGVIDAMRKEARTDRHKIRFVIATDFNLFLVVDTKTGDTLDIEFKDLAKKFDFFLPWAGMEKAVYQGENPADVKAAEKLAKLFDEIKADNFDSTTANDPAKLHELNVFLSRLLFCFFAEDSEIFEDGQFSSAIASHTRDDGSDLSDYLKRLFAVLNQPKPERPGLPDYLSDFPYVNGGLFKDDIEVPTFNRKSRKILIECGAELDWSDINPDIFGSMFQAVVHTEQRSNMGQHYTSVPNIMKVIEPLFLNDLYEELDKYQDSQKKLLELQQRIGKIRIFDPACGSGNFLIIAYKELRKLEMEILKRLQELEFDKSGQMFKPFSVIQLSQFYGIEIDDFAHEVAILSLWLTEHQMNVAFKDEFGETLPSLPLKNGGNIIEGNSTRIDWKLVCPITDDNSEVFILGNPPYLGARNQSDAQKEDMRLVYENRKEYKDSDYVSCWVLKASNYILGTNSRFAFVTTSSISQGEQVSYLWPYVFNNRQEISFAYQPFKWLNNARQNAGIICVIVGVESIDANRPKYLYIDDGVRTVKGISPYLTEGKETIVLGRKKNISGLPKMVLGSMARDGGNLIFNNHDYIEITKKYPDTKRLFRRLYGSKEFIRGEIRWGLWIDDSDIDFARTFPEIDERINNVYEFRINSKAKTTNQYAKIPHKFAQRCLDETNAIIFPRVSSERREYVPIGFLEKGTIISDSAIAMYGAEPYMFSLLTSKMHNVWLKAVGGYLGTSIRYSVAVCFNTFVIPNLSPTLKEHLTAQAFKILGVREAFYEHTFAELYDPDKMPDELRIAHQENDKLVESCYRKKPFESDDERLEHLFNLYEKMIAEEKANA